MTRATHARWTLLATLAVAWNAYAALTGHRFVSEEARRHRLITAALLAGLAGHLLKGPDEN